MILDILENFIYSFAISFLILFNGIIVFLLTSDYPSIYAPLTTIVDYYTSLIEIIFSYIFNVIHTIIPNMPSYDVYSASISFAVAQSTFALTTRQIAKSIRENFFISFLIFYITPFFLSDIK